MSYSSAFSSTLSWSVMRVFTKPTTSWNLSLIVSTMFWAAASATGVEVASGAAFVTMDVGASTPSMPISSVSKTAVMLCQYGTSGTQWMVEGKDVLKVEPAGMGPMARWP